MRDYNSDLHEFFPQYSKLREIQEKAISSVIESGNTLCIMPTGQGKSLIYWMSALELGGICLVVSPLTALISEQVLKLRNAGYDVLELHGSISAEKQMKEILKLAKGEFTPNYIFASPEKIATDGLFEYALRLRSEDVKLVVIDEVHCVSQWGMSFRPFYKRIPVFLDKIFENKDWCRILALTATLNPKELGDICTYFRIAKNNIVKETILMRNEIQLHVHKCMNEDEKTEKFWDIVKIHSDEKILVYVYRKYNKRGVEDLCKQASERGYKAVYFHGDMNAEERAKIVEQYKHDDVKLIFATNAFGMGIDIPDIRVVIHFMIPESVEQYYQEVGRAARDGQGANAYLLYTNKNIDVKRQYFIEKGFPNEEKLKEVFTKIAIKPGFCTLQYFDDDEIQNCLPYYLLCGAIEIVGKGFADLTFLKSIKDAKLQKYYESTKNKAFIRTVKVNSIEPQELSDCVYDDMVNGCVEINRAPERWLLLKVNTTELDTTAIELIMADIEEKKEYKYGLLNYLVKILEDNLNSQQLHQEIARYLGMDRHQLGRIYETLDHIMVRSKSEVIICNLLHDAGIKYKYEQKLYYDDSSYIEPDFTITMNNKTFYWEHVGLLGQEDYDSSWSHKIDVYNNCFPGQMLKTYETGNVSGDAKRIIDKLLQDDA